MTFAFKNSEYTWTMLVDDICLEVSKLTGNVMAEKQRPMVESRMRRRCLDLKINNPGDYKNYWRSHLEVENKVLIGLLTTHFTSFFREFSHFEWIANDLPTLVAAAKKEGRSTLKFWSAASSKGQEVWSLCMWLNHYLPKIDPTMKYLVYGSDIDELSVKEGENGVYHKKELETAPRHLWEGLWVRGKGEIADWYKIKPEIKSNAKFMTQNLLKLTMPASEKFDLIMCRNVLIYFDQQNQEKIIKSLMRYINPQGTLITGMSESLSGYGFELRGVAPSVYKMQSAAIAQLPVTEKAIEPKPVLALPVPLKVLCIDDSPTVIRILQKVLSGPDFQVIDVASNGQEAMEKLKTLKPDVITLDLHMPIMDGPTFLKTTNIAKTIPVIVVSSVERDHAPMIAPMNDLGVCDFVEKPTLANMSEIASELGQKLKMGWWTKKKNLTTHRAVDAVAAKSQRKPAHMIFNFSSSDEKSLLWVLNEQKWAGDELSFVINGQLPLELKTKISLKATMAKKVNFLSVSEKISSKELHSIWLLFNGANTSAYKLNKKAEDFMIMEEKLNDLSLKDMADDCSPATSFSYLIEKLLGAK